MKIMKWIALLGIIMTAGIAFVQSFQPSFEKWREQYPPEPEPEDDDEDPDKQQAQLQTAETLFKVQENQLEQERKEV